MSVARRITFKSNLILSKWGTPNLYGTGKLYEAIKTQSKLIDNTFRPHLLTYNAYVGLFIRHAMDGRHNPTLCYERHTIRMADGGVVGVDELTNPPGKETEKNSHFPNVIIIPNGQKNSYGTWAKVRTKWFIDAGYPKVIVLNPRGTSRTLLETVQLSLAAGKYNDLPGVLEHFIQRNPGKKWLVVGDCWGSTVGLNYFTHPHSTHNAILGGIFDSFQWDGLKLFHNSYYYPTFKLLTINMLKSFVNVPLMCHANKDVYDAVSRLVDREKFENLDYSNTACIRMVYEEFLARLCPGEFTTAEEMHIKFMPGSSGTERKNYMKIQKPVMLINGFDNVFIQPFTNRDIMEMEANPNICMWLFAGGGHTAYVKSLYPYVLFHKDVIMECAEIMGRNDLEL